MGANYVKIELTVIRRGWIQIYSAEVLPGVSVGALYTHLCGQNPVTLLSGCGDKVRTIVINGYSVASDYEPIPENIKTMTITIRN